MSSRLAPLTERLGKAGRIGSNINVCEGDVGFTAEMLGSAAAQHLSDVLRILLVVEHYFMSLLQRLSPRLPLQEVVQFKLLVQARTSQWVTRLKVSRTAFGNHPGQSVDSWVKGDTSADGFKGTVLRVESLEEVIE
jgi:hypothetical protein